MSAAVGAALKKIAISLLSDPKILKKVLAFVLILIIAVLSPFLLIYAIFSGQIQIDPDQITSMAVYSLSEEEKAHLQALENTMTEISTTLTDSGFSSYQVQQGQVLYMLALYPKEKEGNFVSRLNSCFAAEQTDDALIAAVNAEFGTNIVTADFTQLMHSVHKKIVAVALTQIGNVGGQPYWSWYGCPSRIEWCACFVSWCADQCGYIDAGIIPKFSSCTAGMNWFKDKDQWSDNTITPSPGMLIFFDWAKNGQDGSPDHVGIVERVENGIVYTVEGNSGDACRENSYAVGYFEILGYASPAYGSDQSE